MWEISYQWSEMGSVLWYKPEKPRQHSWNELNKLGMVEGGMFNERKTPVEQDIWKVWDRWLSQGGRDNSSLKGKLVLMSVLTDRVTTNWVSFPNKSGSEEFHRSVLTLKIIISEINTCFSCCHSHSHKESVFVGTIFTRVGLAATKTSVVTSHDWSR